MGEENEKIKIWRPPHQIEMANAANYLNTLDKAYPNIADGAY